MWTSENTWNSKKISNFSIFIKNVLTMGLNFVIILKSKQIQNVDGEK